MILVTDKAKEEIISLLNAEGKTTDHNIRVSVKGGGCSGLMYDLSFDPSINESDEVFEEKGVKVIVSPKSLVYLTGMELDFAKEGLNEGFKFNNPNEKERCGCGESFTV